MPVVRSSTFIVAALLAAVGCGSNTVTGPSQGGFGAAGGVAPGVNAAPTGITNATRGSMPAATAPTNAAAAAAASNAMSPIVMMSQPIMPNKPAAPAGGVPGAGVPGAGVPGAPGAGVPGAPGAGIPGAPGAPGAGIPGAPGGAPAAPAGPPGEPVIPEVKGDCPMFRSSTITYMGLGGINVVAGAKGSGEKKAPFVFYWHGTGSFAAEYATMASAVSGGVSQEGGILVSFEGSTGGDFLSGTAIFGKGDFDIADQLLACGVKDYNIDPKRVFATGCSAGGLFSGAMGTARSNYMAAVAPNSGGWTAPVAWQNGWTPALMTVHGAPGADVVIIDFSESSKTADTGYKMRGGF
ncbi:MAG TPA: hypothetical protein VFN67_20670, partial [Polyangiales bacterium]|nr:hypothetical protein [Polyangiales bacterium]